MHRSMSAVALATRAHARDGRQLNSADAGQQLRAAAAELGRVSPECLAGPSEVTPEGILLLALTSPEAVLQAALTIATEMRPAKTSFCAALIPRETPREADRGEPVETTLLAAGSAAREAATRIMDTDPKECRMLILAPEEDQVLSALIDLTLEAYDAMTDRQRQIVDLVRNSDTQQQVATHLNISRQAVNQSLSASGWLHLKRAEEAAASCLVELPEDTTAESAASREPAVV
jgi:hypothetical protein